MSEKTAKEIAFAREHFVAPEFTARFTNLVDEHLVLPLKGKFLYVEAGTGTHAFEIREKLGEKVEMSASDAQPAAARIAAEKAAVLKADIAFDNSAPDALSYEDDEFDTVIYDASQIPPLELKNVLPEVLPEIARVARPKAAVAFFLPTAGSYGEFFSVLWETLYNAGLSEHSASVEQIINALPTVSEAEDFARAAGLRFVETKTAAEFFDFESAEEFLAAPIVTEFLMPMWLSSLPPEIRQKAADSLAQTIDAERSGMSFRFSIKTALVAGEKV